MEYTSRAKMKKKEETLSFHSGRAQLNGTGSTCSYGVSVYLYGWLNPSARALPAQIGNRDRREREGGIKMCRR
jgi:hypothetical protein